MEQPTQDFLEIDDVKDGIMILKNGQIRGVLLVSSVNFALKSQEEQSAITYAFQSFLNSLDFPCQIITQSRNINITPYLDSIKKLEENQTNELLKTQIASYEEFIKELVKVDIVMTKNFYVIVPYNLAEVFGAGAAAIKSNPFKIFGEGGGRKISDADFEKYKNQLWQRMEFLAVGLKRCELEVMPLNSIELIEMLWAIHHPDEAEVGYYPEIPPELIK